MTSKSLLRLFNYPTFACKSMPERQYIIIITFHQSGVALSLCVKYVVQIGATSARSIFMVTALP